jgi:hypothetical protein
MAHLLYLRIAKSFTCHPEATYGHSELVERDIDNVEYDTLQVTKGKNRVMNTQIQLHNSRVKWDSMADFVQDLGCINLNPTPNKTSIFDILIKDKKYSTIGRSFILIRWIMKWVNRKKTTAGILFLIAILTFQLWLLLFVILILVNPIKPIPVNTNKVRNKFGGTSNWTYHIGLGCLNDPKELQDDVTNEYQEDIL